MKRKIAIITTFHVPNYGNKLQNYALQTVIASMGYKVDTVKNLQTYHEGYQLFKAFIHIISHFRLTPRHLQIIKFWWWSRKHIQYSPIVYRKESDAQRLIGCYDGFVVGSDQIWNPLWTDFSNKFGFLQFAPPKQRIAYAPSFGISNMIPERKTEIANYLEYYAALSVREYSGAKIIKNLINTDVPVVLDPTLLINSSVWYNLAKPINCPTKYLVIYSIGKLTDNDYIYAQEIAHTHDLQILDLNESLQFGTVAPDEWLYLMKNAQYVVTNSFHGSVFSFIFHRKMTILQQGKSQIHLVSSRLHTLLYEMGIETDISKTRIILDNIDWIKVEQHLAILRDESMNYLRTNLEKLYK